jgi:hypothetical protein
MTPTCERCEEVEVGYEGDLCPTCKFEVDETW